MRVQTISLFTTATFAGVWSFTVNRGCSHFSLSHGVRERSLPLQMSFYADSSDYKSSDSDFSDEEDAESKYGVPVQDDGEDDSPTIEETPVPMSKNSGNRFVALMFDKLLSSNSGEEEIDVMQLHENRIALTEDHVLFCRKANLYNETFNTDSMADVIWSHQMLSSDVRRTVGHAMCVESTTLDFAQDLISRDPIVQHLTGGDLTNIPLYRWRQIRDFTLLQDDGRHGVPFMLIGLDRSAEEGGGNIRDEMEKKHLEYLIRSEKVVAAGGLYLPTSFKDDPSSIPVGDLIIFNAANRDEAIEFAENDPYALSGLYDSMRLHRFNSLDVSGKFVADNMLHKDSNPCSDMKEAMEFWGYPVGDRETKWINW